MRQGRRELNGRVRRRREVDRHQHTPVPLFDRRLDGDAAQRGTCLRSLEVDVYRRREPLAQRLAASGIQHVQDVRACSVLVRQQRCATHGVVAIDREVGCHQDGRERGHQCCLHDQDCSEMRRTCHACGARSIALGSTRPARRRTQVRTVQR
ncbi:MAG TPA: hypothetical protein VLA16_16805 [Ideonella sp.]|nr:hypothetical protein [Ideonella sp.]